MVEVRQLRDLIICPKERGVVNYVQQRKIVEHNLRTPNALPRTIADLDFTPNSLTSLRLGPGGEDVLLAAGGQDADIHISYHTAGQGLNRNRSLKNLWSIDGKLSGSINNSVLLTTATSSPLSLAQSNQSSIEPRIGVSNNDCTVRLYDVPLRGQNLKRVRRNEQSLTEVGILRLDVAVNHYSNKVYIHNITGGASVDLSHVVTYTLPDPDYSSIPAPSGSFVASFSTAFSGDGLKFAVASQEGVVAVWDVRSSKPLKVYHTEKTRSAGVGRLGNGHASGWLSDDPWDWTRGSSRPPGWSVRNVKFGGSARGKEVLTFTEHTSFIHIIDARTFETEEVLRMPTVRKAPTPTPPLATSTSQPITRPSSTSRNRYLQPPATAPHSFYSFPSPSPSPRRSSSPRTMLNGRRVPGSPPPASPPSARRLTPSIVHAVGDAFRVAYSPPESIGDSTWRTLHGLGGSRSPPPDTNIASAPTPASASVSGRTSGSEITEAQLQEPRWQSDFDDIVVIPPLGDTEEESEIHALLRMHGMTTMQSRGNLNAELNPQPGGSGGGNEEEEEEGEEEGSMETDIGSVSQPPRWRRGEGAAGPSAPLAMDVDELESCVSSHAPSRSGSPAPMFPSARSWAANSSSSSTRARSGHVEEDEEEEEEERGDEDDDMEGVWGGVREKVDELQYENHLDIAGLCFDPSGQSIYVASSKSVAEWRVKGGEKMWWPSDGWR
ncbi:hypothetical protein DFP72DRAFT_1033104 [Ephemerocybe angulata]|uniref:DUF2415 domain-containing protein n=1 Tax=Ephemerocybe angulata TaxID=980116 RepID=A0A8H6HYM4_9AGAR|nr:hypothetical protein DFP72DRAFT_1033104 [Tulosesus angulatus]